MPRVGRLLLAAATLTVAWNLGRLASAQSWESHSSVVTAVYASDQDRSAVVPAGFSAPARADKPVSDAGLQWLTPAAGREATPLRMLPKKAASPQPIETATPKRAAPHVLPVVYDYHYRQQSGAVPAIAIPDPTAPNGAAGGITGAAPATASDDDVTSPVEPIDPREFRQPVKPESGYAQGGLGEEKCPEASDLTPISKIDYSIAPPKGRFPQECKLSREDHEGRVWAPTTFAWTASALCHKPSYFEDVHLERYGHTWGPIAQPLVSAGHFFLTVPVLPYKMGLYPPHECQYSLGYYRPGSCAPYMLDPLPLSVRAGVMEAAAWTGGVFLIP